MEDMAGAHTLPFGGVGEGGAAGRSSSSKNPRDYRNGHGTASKRNYSRIEVRMAP